MSKFIRVIIVIIITFLLITTVLLKTQLFLKIDCKVKSGSWTETSVGNYCYYPSYDWKKKCYQKSDCTNDCEYKGVDSDGYFYGECTKFAGSSLCADTLNEKTKDITKINKPFICVQ